MCYPCGSYGKIMDSTEDFPASEGVGLETTSAVGETGPGSELELGEYIDVILNQGLIWGICMIYIT